MTAKRDSERKPKSDDRPRVKKETLKDLEASEEQAREARGGRRAETYNCDNCTGKYTGCIS
jgi:hypothetical protein